MSVAAARRLRVGGHVQGVGFRPFVYRLARELSLTGTVQNLTGEVEILVQGAPCDIERFCEALTQRAPPLARPQLTASAPAAAGPARDFRILDSATGEAPRVFVPPDSFVCADCRAELTDPDSRRHRHPFINCTQCGPRYTVIEALPYDRARTTLAGFPLCRDCQREYTDPTDRRFHAEPTACPACGPAVWLVTADTRLEREDALARAVALLAAGAVLAVKGVGGYHLMCDATSEDAVARLRRLKQRPDKPLAVMFPEAGADGLDAVREQVRINSLEAALLTSPARPIVLVTPLPGATLAAQIAPGLAQTGVLLPASPLHHLLLRDLGRPLVATSGNLSGEPVQTDPQAAQAAFAQRADACLHHDRPIARPADDPVMRVTHGQARTLRLGRGVAPLELSLPAAVPHPVIAVGGHQKTTVALAFGERLVVSPHIADMGSVRSEQVLSQVIEDLQRLYGVRAQEVVCDAHPGYATTGWARRCGLPLRRVWHHHAHAAGLAAQHPPAASLLVFAWDGSGLGPDGTLWGGETLLGRPGQWRRVASLRPFRLPGGERAARQPWRSWAGLCWELGEEPDEVSPDPRVRAAWRAGIHSPATSAVGRLLDAAAAVLLGIHETSHEGQGPMRMEALAAEHPSAGGDTALTALAPLPVRPAPEGLLHLDWAPLLPLLRDAARGPAERAWLLHAHLAVTIAQLALALRRLHGVTQVGLTGGVFQNALLTQLAHRQLTALGFDVLLTGQVPCNDGGLSHGQVIEHLARVSGWPG